MNSLPHHLPDWQSDYAQWLEQGTAPSTRRAYQRDVTYFWQWVHHHLDPTLTYPISAEGVLQFCLYHLDPHSPTPLKVATLRRYLASVSVAHVEAGVASPLQDKRIRLLLKKVKAAKQERPVKKRAITDPILDQLLAACDNSLHGIRDRAILLVGMKSGGRRRQELAQLRVDDLTPIEDGYDLTIRQSKTDQTCEGHTVPLTGDTAQALRAWLMQSGIRTGYLFRGIKSDGRVYDSITGRTINNIVKRRIQRIGLDPDQFGAHSLRAGFITSATLAGMSIYEAVKYSGHKDIETAQGYVRLPEHGFPLSPNKAPHHD